MLTTAGVTLSSIGAKLGICSPFTDTGSAAVAGIGVMIELKLKDRTVKASKGFFIMKLLIDKYLVVINICAKYQTSTDSVRVMTQKPF
jgi:hypothetical protein